MATAATRGRWSGRGASTGGPRSPPTARWSPTASSCPYVEVVDIATGAVTTLDASSEEPAWYGNDTLIVDD